MRDELSSVVKESHNSLELFSRFRALKVLNWVYAGFIDGFCTSREDVSKVSNHTRSVLQLLRVKRHVVLTGFLKEFMKGRIMLLYRRGADKDVVNVDSHVRNVPKNLCGFLVKNLWTGFQTIGEAFKSVGAEWCSDGAGLR